MEFQLLFVAICLIQAVNGFLYDNYITKTIICGADNEPLHGRLDVRGFGHFIVHNFYQCLNLGMRLEICSSVNYDTISRECQLNTNVFDKNHKLISVPYSLYSPITRQQCQQQGSDDLNSVCGHQVCNKTEFCLSIGSSTKKATCLSVVKNCGSPPKVENAEFKLVSKSWLDNAKYICNVNYKHMDGSQTIQCTNRGWTTPAIVCARL